MSLKKKLALKKTTILFNIQPNQFPANPNRQK